MNYPAAKSGVSEDRNGIIMPPHPNPLPQGERGQVRAPDPALSREGRGQGVTPQLAAGDHPG